MFSKINIKHNLQYNNEDKINSQFVYEKNEQKYGYISYKVLDKGVIDIVNSIIPIEYQPDFFISLIEIRGERLKPHIDVNILSAINFYIETADAITSFYKPKSNIKINKIPIIPNSDGFTYFIEELDLIGKFKAEYGDIYLLDVKKIHDVVGDKTKYRRAYSLASNKYNYEEVLQILTQEKIEYTYKGT